MPVTVASRVAARAVISAALAAGSLSLTVTAAGACTGPAACGGGPPPATASLTCTTPDCIRGVPPAAAAMECTDPKCVSGTPPAAALRPGSRPAGQAGHGSPPARTADEASTPRPAALAHAGPATAINCPPPNPSVAATISDC